MDEGLKFAAIDVGSNAVRLLFNRVLEKESDVKYIKESFFRVPLRLGEDAFSINKISKNNISRLLDTMKDFEHLIKAYKPLDHEACATSALRSAKNGHKIIEKINNETNLDLRIISGKEEAGIIIKNNIEKQLDMDTNYVYIDVGGGSTEITFIVNQKEAYSKSFPIGSVRILKDSVTDKDWSYFKSWIKTRKSKIDKPIIAIGSGGNINKISSIIGKSGKKGITYSDIESIIEMIEPYSLHDRVEKLNLSPDRADVITHAGKIYLKAMTYAETRKMIVPNTGLSDGIIRKLYSKHKEAIVQSK